MDYSSYFPAQYPFMGLSSRTEHSYSPHDDLPHDLMVRIQVWPIPTPLRKLNHNAWQGTYANTGNPYHAFNQQFQYTPSQVIAQPQSPPPSIHQSSISQTMNRENSGSRELPELDTYDQAQGRSSDEEKDNLTPAQSRRKAQNRAAYDTFLLFPSSSPSPSPSLRLEAP